MPVTSPVGDIQIPENLNLWEYIKSYTKKNVDRTAYVDANTGNKLTFPQFLSGVERITQSLWERGFHQGDTLLVVSPNNVYIPVILFAVGGLGGTVSLCNPLCTKEDLSSQIQETGPKFVATARTLVPLVSSCGFSQMNIILLDDASTTLCIPFSQLMNTKQVSYQAPAPAIEPKQDVVWVPYSSGTTGKPKGVLLTHYNVVAVLHQIRHPSFLFDQTGYTPGNYILYLPLYHIFGLMMLCFALILGKTVVLMEKFHLTQYLQLLQLYKPTVISLVPPVATLLAKNPDVDKYDLSSIQTIAIGAAQLTHELDQQVRKRIGVRTIIQGYGMTETCGLICFTPHKHDIPGSLGVPLPNTVCKVVNPETGQEVGVGEEGEICAKGPQMMKGYLNNPTATRNTVDNQGWLHTGDIGYYNNDGFFFITGRLKELIKYKALQVAPATIEAVLLSHTSVVDAAVVGVPDPYAGELPKAFVVVRPGHNVSSKNLQLFVKERVAPHYNLQGGVEFIDEIPKSASGKILRNQLKQRSHKAKL